MVEKGGLPLGFSFRVNIFYREKEKFRVEVRVLESCCVVYSARFYIDKIMKYD